MIKVTSVEHLKELAYREDGEHIEFYLILAGGLARSCKRISYMPNEYKNWSIVHEIDDSYQELIDRSLAKRTNIVDAIEKGCFFLSDMYKSTNYFPSYFKNDLKLE